MIQSVQNAELNLRFMNKVQSEWQVAMNEKKQTALSVIMLLAARELTGS